MRKADLRLSQCPKAKEVHVDGAVRETEGDVWQGELLMAEFANRHETQRRRSGSASKNHHQQFAFAIW